MAERHVCQSRKRALITPLKDLVLEGGGSGNEGGGKKSFRGRGIHLTTKTGLRSRGRDGRPRLHLFRSRLQEKKELRQ